LFSEKVRGAYNTANMSTDDENQQQLSQWAEAYNNCCDNNQPVTANDIRETMTDFIAETGYQTQNSVNESCGDDQGK
jgi:hypothetical protein